MALRLGNSLNVHISNDPREQVVCIMHIEVVPSVPPQIFLAEMWQL